MFFKSCTLLRWFVGCLSQLCVTYGLFRHVYHVESVTSQTDGFITNSFNSFVASNEKSCASMCLSNDECCSTYFHFPTGRCYLFQYQVEVTSDNQSQSLLLSLIKDKISILKCPYQDCQEAFEQSDIRQNGVYSLRPPMTNKTISAVCQFDSSSGWTVIQKRQDGTENFYRGWSDYKNGFGDSRGEYWIGLETIHRLTTTNRKLSVYLEDHDGNHRTANFSSFSVGDSNNFYQLSVSGYSGDAGDSLTYHSDMKFATYDADNDKHGGNCAIACKGAWWYNSCHDSNLNGVWYANGIVTQSGTAASWDGWQGMDYSYKTIYIRITR